MCWLSCYLVEQKYRSFHLTPQNHHCCRVCYFSIFFFPKIFSKIKAWFKLCCCFYLQSNWTFSWTENYFTEIFFSSTWIYFMLSADRTQAGLVLFASIFLKRVRSQFLQVFNNPYEAPLYQITITNNFVLWRCDSEVNKNINLNTDIELILWQEEFCSWKISNMICIINSNTY